MTSSSATAAALITHIGKKIVIAKAGDEHDFDAAFATLVQGRVGALLVGGEPLFVLKREQLIALAARHAAI